MTYVQGAGASNVVSAKRVSVNSSYLDFSLPELEKLRRASDVLAPWLHKPHATIRHCQHTEGWSHPRSCQPLGVAVVLKHLSMELKRTFPGWLHTTLAEISTETHLAVRRRVGVST